LKYQNAKACATQRRFFGIKARPPANSYRNLVSCCVECNSRKSDRAARDFLRTLYRQGRLTPAEFDARLRALKDLAAGKLRPSLPSA
jgi:5-methylcytosine-specific restriction endonuclease McrA